MSTTKKRSSLNFLILGAIFILAMVSATAFFNSKKLSGSIISNVDTNTYQAIKLNTGETYFGKISEEQDAFILLEDVYYFRNDEKTKLIKRSSSDGALNSNTMLINRNHVFSIENLSQSSPVIKAIQKYQRDKK